jgi:orotate phosphoribosyltransferase-like protein
MALQQEAIRKIIQLRGLGYKQQEIADKLGISRKTVESHLRKLRIQAEEAEKDNGLEDLFSGLVLGPVGAALISKLLHNSEV